MPSRKELGEERSIVAFSYKFRPEIPISVSAPEDIVNALGHFLAEENPVKNGKKKFNFNISKEATKFLYKELNITTISELNKHSEIKSLNQQYITVLCRILDIKDHNFSKFHLNKFLKPLLNEKRGYNF